MTGIQYGICIRKSSSVEISVSRRTDTEEEDVANGLIPLKEYHPSTFVTSREIVASMVEFNSRYDISWFQEC